jgi:ABC-type polysaccharide/polyol phosphate export permease
MTLAIQYNPSRLTLMRRLVQDFVSGAKAWPLWTFLGWNDVRLRYRRTVLGPFWQTGNVLLFVAGLGAIYAMLWRMPLAEFFPWFCAGYLSWLLVSTLISEGCLVFINNVNYIKQHPVPLSIYIYKAILRNLIAYVHYLPVFFLIAVIFGSPFNWHLLLLPLSLVIISVTSVWVILLLGLLCTRFRDVQNLITNILQALFFITPVIWHPEVLRDKPLATLLLLDLNPLYHYIELIRDPLLGRSPEPLSWIFTGVMSVGGLLVAAFIAAPYRKKLIFWL